VKIFAEINSNARGWQVCSFGCFFAMGLCDGKQPNVQMWEGKTKLPEKAESVGRKIKYSGRTCVSAVFKVILLFILFKIVNRF